MSQVKEQPIKRALQRIASLQLQGGDGYRDDLVKIITRDPATMERWSLPLTAAGREARNNAIFDHWLAGGTSVEIASKLHIKRQSVDEIIANAVKFKRDNICITEKPPVYNVWNYAGCDPRFGQKHPGQIPGQAVIHLLLWLTILGTPYLSASRGGLHQGQRANRHSDSRY